VLLCPASEPQGEVRLTVLLPSKSRTRTHLVAVNVTVHNSGEKPLWIHDIKATIKTDSSEFSDGAASAVDFDRYFQAFPTRRNMPARRYAGDQDFSRWQAQGTVVVSFPVTQDGFDKRKSFERVIQPTISRCPDLTGKTRECSQTRFAN